MGFNTTSVLFSFILLIEGLICLTSRFVSSNLPTLCVVVPSLVRRIKRGKPKRHGKRAVTRSSKGMGPPYMTPVLPLDWGMHPQPTGRNQESIQGSTMEPHAYSRAREDAQERNQYHLQDTQAPPRSISLRTRVVPNFKNPSLSRGSRLYSPITDQEDYPWVKRKWAGKQTACRQWWRYEDHTGDWVSSC